MSSTFSANSGSLLILKVRNKCGFRPCLLQMRRTEDALRPTARAMFRVLQWVASCGFSWVVILTIFWTRRVETLGFRPGRGASFSMPAIPEAMNRPRQRATVCRAIVSSSAICWSCFPAFAIRIIFARIANRTVVVRPRANFSNSSRCESERLILGATRMVICLPRLKRCEQRYVALFTAQYTRRVVNLVDEYGSPNICAAMGLHGEQ